MARTTGEVEYESGRLKLIDYQKRRILRLCYFDPEYLQPRTNAVRLQVVSISSNPINVN
jgi:hypothetical protein